jgi:hypothetical protein
VEHPRKRHPHVDSDVEEAPDGSLTCHITQWTCNTNNKRRDKDNNDQEAWYHNTEHQEMDDDPEANESEDEDSFCMLSPSSHCPYSHPFGSTITIAAPPASSSTGDETVCVISPLT